MALNKQLIPVSFGQGVNTKVDKFQMQGSFLELENAFQVKTGELQLRNGFDQLSNATIGANPDPFVDVVYVDSSVGLTTYNDELIQVSENRLWSWAPQIEKWAYKGPIVLTDISTIPIVSNSYEQTSYDMALTRGIAIYAWEDSRGGVRSQVADLDSGAILLQDTELNVNGRRPRCMAVGQYLFVYYYDVVTYELLVRRVDISQPQFSDEVLVASDISPSRPYFDVCLVGTSRMVVAYRSNLNELKLLYFLQTNQVGGTITGVPDPISIPTVDPDQSLTCFTGEGYSGVDTFHVAWGSSTGGVAHIGFYNNFTEYMSELVLDGYAETRNITGIAYDTYVDLYWEDAKLTDGYVTATYIDITTNEANTGEPPVVLQRKGGLASKAYRGPGGLVSTVLISHETDNQIQNTYFTVNNDTFVYGSPSEEGQIEGKILSQAAAGNTVNDSCLPGVWQSGGNYFIPCGRQTRLVVGTSTTFSLIGFNRITISYNTTTLGIPSQLGENLFIPGGFLRAYDGVSCIEQNYHLFPEEPLFAKTPPPAGNVANGTYQYCIVFEWIDAKGQIFQSEPSIPVTKTVTGGPIQVEMFLQTLTYTDKKEPFRTSVIISVYRTEDNGTIFYKVSDDTNPVYNDLHVDRIPFTDNIGDADLIERPLLYTTGGILENTPAPSANVVKAAKNRLFAAGLQNPNQISFSKEFVVNESVNFAPGFTIQLENAGGPITAIGEMDEKVIIFKRTAIYYLTGDGPNDLGQGSFTVTKIATDVGCSEPESIVQIPDGLMFKSQKGIWILTRGLTTEYIGDRVEDYNSYDVTSAVVVADLNQARFTTLEGTTLIYDYYFKQWSTANNQNAVAAVNWQNNYVFTRANGYTWIENRTSYADNGTPIIPIIGTQWFSFAQIQGFQRVQKALILGKYKGEHKLKVTVYYDFREAPEDVFYYNLENNSYGTVYGDPDGEVYGTPEGEVYGITDGIYQFQIDFSIQKCQSIRLVIESVFPNSTGTAAFTLSAISFLVGIKKGPERLPDSKILTTSGT